MSTAEPIEVYEIRTTESRVPVPSDVAKAVLELNVMRASLEQTSQRMQIYVTVCVLLMGALYAALVYTIHIEPMYLVFLILAFGFLMIVADRLTAIRERNFYRHLDTLPPEVVRVYRSHWKYTDPESGALRTPCTWYHSISS